MKQMFKKKGREGPHGVEERISVSDSRAMLPKYCVMAYMESRIVGVQEWEGMAQGFQTRQVQNSTLVTFIAFYLPGSFSLGQ